MVEVDGGQEPVGLYSLSDVAAMRALLLLHQQATDDPEGEKDNGQSNPAACVVFNDIPRLNINTPT